MTDEPEQGGRRERALQAAMAYVDLNRCVPGWLGI